MKNERMSGIACVNPTSSLKLEKYFSKTIAACCIKLLYQSLALERDFSKCNC